MESHDIIDSIREGERVSCNYAELYFYDPHCEYIVTNEDEDQEKNNVSSKNKDAEAELNTNDEWTSPSDLLIGKVDLVPPFTSKITRGITHKGILEIGDAVLEKEYAKFLQHLNELLADNDAAWNQIQDQEREKVKAKVKALYEEIFKKKSKTFQEEISRFYEITLYELEEHLRSEVQTVLMHAHCNMVADLNQEIKEKLAREKHILVEKLRKIYNAEVQKLTKYYYLLLNNEKHRSNRLVNQALRERNEAIKAFCSHFEAETSTGTMYIMCAERRKCKMRKFLLENCHTKEIQEKLSTIKEKQEILDDFNKRKKRILDINQEWEDKIKKLLQLFLKFISFSLKLLPEQTTFLLDLEKLVVLQLNEIQKNPENAKSIIIEQNKLLNMFEFHKDEPESVCDKEPFTVDGDTASSVAFPYGSRETIPDDVELPFFRLQRQFIYAKCQKIDEVRAFLDAKRCKCRDVPPTLEPSHETSQKPSLESTHEVQNEDHDEKTPAAPTESGASLDLYMVDDIQRLQECPLRKCKHLTDILSFPNLNDYLDFNEEKFQRVKAILEPPARLEPLPKKIDPKELIRRDLPFAATKEPYHTVETQYSSQEEIDVTNIPCSCVSERPVSKVLKKSISVQQSPEEEKLKIDAVLEKRRYSLRRIMHENPNLLRLFTDESYDFIY